MSIDKLTSIENEIQLKINELKTSSLKPTIIAVSKTFPIENILPLVKFGHAHFGENKVQEALDKWTEIKADNKNIKLHLIGPLQTNKVKFALKIFDYIHSVDREKLAIKIADEQNKQSKQITKTNKRMNHTSTNTNSTHQQQQTTRTEHRTQQTADSNNEHCKHSKQSNQQTKQTATSKHQPT